MTIASTIRLGDKEAKGQKTSIGYKRRDNSNYYHHSFPASRVKGGATTGSRIGESCGKDKRNSTTASNSRLGREEEDIKEKKRRHCKPRHLLGEKEMDSVTAIAHSDLT